MRDAINNKERELIQQYRQAEQNNTASESELLSVKLFDILEDIVSKTIDLAKTLKDSDSDKYKDINIEGVTLKRL